MVLFFVACIGVIAYHLISFTLDLFEYKELLDREKDTNEVTIEKKNVIRLRIKIIDFLNLLLSTAYMIPLSALGLFFVFSGFIIMVDPAQENGAVGGIIFIILGLTPILAGIRPFLTNLQVFQAQYFGVFIEKPDKTEQKAELLRRLPSILASAILIIGSIITACAKNPVDSGITGTIIQLILALIIMTAGLFFLVHSIKKIRMP